MRSSCQNGSACASSWPEIPSTTSAISGRRPVSNGGSATSRMRRSTTSLPRPPSHCSLSARLDQSGASCGRSDPEQPSPYDVGGMAEPVRRYGAGLVVPADDIDALAEGVGRLSTTRMPSRARVKVR